MNNSSYWKAVFSSYLFLMTTVILFFVCMCGNGRIRESIVYEKLTIAVVAVVVGVAFTLISRRLSGGEKPGWVWYLTAVIGNALTMGGLIAAVSPLIASIAYLFKGTHGFGMCFFAWIALSLMIGCCTGLFVGSLKSALSCLRSFDLSGILLSLMLAVAGIYGVIPCITVAMSISGLVGFGCFMGLLGGGALGAYAAPAAGTESVVYDANGNPHYIVSRISPNRVVCTDGQTWRYEADGHASVV